MITAKSEHITRIRVDFCNMIMIKYSYPIMGKINIFLDRYTHNSLRISHTLYVTGDSDVKKWLAD